jgi:hypothetical protein
MATSPEHRSSIVLPVEMREKMRVIAAFERHSFSAEIRALCERRIKEAEAAGLILPGDKLDNGKPVKL